MIEAGVWQEALNFGIVRSSPKWASSLSICSSQSPGNSEGGGRICNATYRFRHSNALFIWGNVTRDQFKARRVP